MKLALLALLVCAAAFAQTAGPMPTVPFANLGNRVDGTIVYCPNCQPTNPCLGGGPGGFAQRANGSWNCAASNGGGAGTVTFVGLTMPAIFSVTPGSIISAATFVVTANGTAGGIAIFDTATTMASTLAGTATQVIHGGTVPVWGAVVLADIDPAALSGNGSKIATTTGALTNGHCVSLDASGNFVDAGSVCGGGGGGGSVTSVGLDAPGVAFFAITNSPVVGAATMHITVSGATTGAVVYASSATAVAMSSALGNGLVVIGGGAAGPSTIANAAGLLHSGTPPTWSAVVIGDIASGSLSGAGTGNKVATTLGTLTPAHCVQIDASGNLIDAGATCGTGGGGGGSFSAISSGTNAIAAMLVGNSATLGPSGTGIITANAYSGVLPGANGGTGNGFMSFAGPATTPKVYTLPNSSTTILTTSSAVTVPQGGTGNAGGTSGGFPCYDTNSTMTSSGVMTANAIIKGAGVGLCPTASGVTIDGSNNVSTPGSGTFGAGSATLSSVFLSNPTSFAALAGLVDSNGTQRWCNDCTSPSSPASGSGTGAMVVRQNGAWVALGSGSTAAFSVLTSGTNSGAVMIVGTGASLSTSGTGTITATSLSGYTVTGNGAKLASSTGTLNNGNCVKIDANSNFVDAGAACGSGGGGGGGGIGSTFSGTVTFSSAIPDGTCSAQTFAATGATTGATVAPGWPSGFTLDGSMWVSAADTMKVELCNHTGAPVTPGALSVSASTVGPVLTSNALNTTSTDGLVLINNTAALTGQQQISPRLRLTSSGWGTIPGASQVGDIVIENLPIRDTTVDPMMRISYQGAGGGYVQVANFGPIVSFHTGFGMYLGTATPTVNNYIAYSDNTDLYINAPSVAGVTHFKANNSATDRVSIDSNGLISAAAGGTFLGKLSTPQFVITGTRFTASGCTVTPVSGGNTGGTFTVGAGACAAVTVTLGGTTAANGWACIVNNRTTPANKWGPTTGGSTTTAVFTGTSAGTDTIEFGCISF